MGILVSLAREKHVPSSEGFSWYFIGHLTYRDKLDQHQGFARLFENLLVILLRVAVDNPGEGHHLAGAASASPHLVGKL